MQLGAIYSEALDRPRTLADWLFRLNSEHLEMENTAMYQMIWLIRLCIKVAKQWEMQGVMNNYIWIIIRGPLFITIRKEQVIIITHEKETAKEKETPPETTRNATRLQNIENPQTTLKTPQTLKCGICRVSHGANCDQPPPSPQLPTMRSLLPRI